MLGDGRPFVLEVANSRARMPPQEFFQEAQEALDREVGGCAVLCCAVPRCVNPLRTRCHSRGAARPASTLLLRRASPRACSPLQSAFRGGFRVSTLNAPRLLSICSPHPAEGTSAPAIDCLQPIWLGRTCWLALHGVENAASMGRGAFVAGGAPGVGLLRVTSRRTDPPGGAGRAWRGRAPLADGVKRGAGGAQGRRDVEAEVVRCAVPPLRTAHARKGVRRLWRGGAATPRPSVQGCTRCLCEPLVLRKTCRC
jgi:hypothetical protein